MTNEELAAAAREAAKGAYSPYSKFRVGAIVLGRNGEIVSGVNVENAAYPSSTCAEANAVTTAVAQGIRDIEAVAVVCLDAETIDGGYPCGRCRQVMNEFGVDRVVVSSADGSEIREHKLSELLPFGFEL